MEHIDMKGTDMVTGTSRLTTCGDAGRKDVSATSFGRRTFLKGLAVFGATGLLGSLAGCGFNEVDSSTAQRKSYDLVVVGAGGAGLCAAVAASDAGIKSILVIERSTVCGGNTISAASGMNASQTAAQTAAGITDTNDTFTAETYAIGGSVANTDLVSLMCQNSSAAIDWLSGFGVTLDNLATTYGSSVPRCHRPTDASSIGLKLISSLATEASARSIDIVYQQRANELLVDNASGAVTGVVAVDPDGTTTTYDAKAVILATGGFCANPSMVAQYRSDLIAMPAVGIATTMGDGITMASNIGAGTVDMDRILRFPTAETETHTLISESLRNQGAILVNTAGNRFCNEIDSYENLSANIAAQDQGYAWLVYDQTISDVTKAVTAGYLDAGLTLMAADAPSLAASMNVDATAFQATIDTLNQVASGAATDAFSRTTNLSVLTTASWYAIKVSPCIFDTSGGVLTGTNANVLNQAQTAIPGLFAAGEVTGGIHGAAMIFGNGLTDAVVFGKLAGEQAALSINGPAASTTSVPGSAAPSGSQALPGSAGSQVPAGSGVAPGSASQTGSIGGQPASAPTSTPASQTASATPAPTA